MAQRKTTFEMCDNPECGNEYEVFKSEPLPGFVITRGSWDNGAGGGPIPQTYACSVECLPAAVLCRIGEEG
jgi:hypothetical protein